MRSPVTRLREENSSRRVIVPPKLDKIDDNGKGFNSQEVWHRGTRGWPASPANSDLRSGGESRPGNGGALWTGIGPALARGHGFCFLGLSGHRRPGILSRVHEISRRTSRFRPGGGCSLLHSVIWMVRSELVLAHPPEGMT